MKQLNDEDTRTFGVCIGIKTRRKSEVFSSILVRRKPLISIFGWGFLHVYDILCAHDFNPNERTGFVFSQNNPKFLLGEQLRRSVIAFYENRADKTVVADKKVAVAGEKIMKKKLVEYVHQCKHCFTVYDEVAGEPDHGITAGTAFESLPQGYCCSLCESGKEEFIKVEKSVLGLQAV